MLLVDFSTSGGFNIRFDAGERGLVMERRTAPFESEGDQPEDHISELPDAEKKAALTPTPPAAAPQPRNTGMLSGRVHDQAPAAPISAPTAAAPTGKKFCGNCGTKRKGAAKFCGECGTKS